MFRFLTRDYIILATLLMVILASGGDLISDLDQGVQSRHLIQEGGLLAIATLALAWILYGIRQQTREIASLNGQLEEARNLKFKGSDQLLDARRTLSDLMAAQFTDWGLTKSEREIGQFLLKGLSVKEIAVLRGTAEKTIRQQASSIYQKAGVTGRHSLSAWFIEDFL